MDMNPGVGAADRLLSHRPETDMRFFRRDRRFVWLALFALTAQLVLTFGHIHLHAIQHHQAAVAAAGTCASHVQSPCPNHSDDDAICPICNLITLAGTLVPPQPIAIDLPKLVSNVVAPQRSIGSFTRSETVHFQARAPPPVAAAT